MQMINEYLDNHIHINQKNPLKLFDIEENPTFENLLKSYTNMKEIVSKDPNDNKKEILDSAFVEAWEILKHSDRRSWARRIFDAILWLIFISFWVIVYMGILFLCVLGIVFLFSGFKGLEQGASSVAAS